MSQTAKANPRGIPSQDHHTPSGFSSEHRPDPSNPLASEYDRGTVPEGLATRRALREMRLSPGANQGPVAILRCKLCATRPHWACLHPTRGYLFRIDLAPPPTHTDARPGGRARPGHGRPAPGRTSPTPWASSATRVSGRPSATAPTRPPTPEQSCIPGQAPLASKPCACPGPPHPYETRGRTPV